MAERRQIVCVENVVKDFRPGFGLRRKRVLHGVTFEVLDGEIFGFVGPNGSGKTTTLKVLMGLIRPTEGRASILGRDVEESEFRNQVGFLPENPYFYPHLSAREVLDFYARLCGVDSSHRAERVEELLEMVHLSYSADARLETFSKGMLQRIGVAQALINDPRVVFFDEPMSGLDPIGRKEIRDVILALRAAGKTVFMNTHILSDVELICDRVAIIVKGVIRRQGRIEEVLPETEAETAVVLSRLAPEVVTRIEEDLGAELRGLGERVEWILPAKKVQKLVAAALESGAEIVSITPHRSSLEDVFMSVVREGEES